MLVTPDNKKIHFGAKNMSDYTIHKDDNRKQNYINRHQKRETWGEINPGSLSRFILWEYKDLDKAIKEYGNRFNI